MKRKIKYKFPHHEMIAGAFVVAEALSDNSSELIVMQSNWDSNYIDGFKKRIGGVSSRYLGVDYAQMLKEKTNHLLEKMKEAHSLLRVTRRQIEVHFENDEKMLSDLGFKLYWPKIYNSNDQEAMVSLLESYRRNINNYLADFAAKGVPEETLLKVANMYDDINSANISQEQMKSNKVVLAENGYNEFNAIYTEAIGICKIARSFYKDNPSKRNMFNFSRIIKKMNNRGERKDI